MEKKKVVSKIERQEEEIQAANLYYAISGTNLAVTNGHVLWVYDLEQKTCTHQIEYESEDFIYRPSMVFNEDGSEIAMSTGSPARKMLKEAYMCVSCR